MPKRVLAGAALLCLLAGAVRADAGPNAGVDAVLATPGFQHGQWSLLVVDSKTGQVVFECNAN